MKEFDEFDIIEDSDDKSVDLMPYVRKALKSWKTIFLWACIGGVLGVIFCLSTPRRYTSEAVIAPELVTRATAGGLSSLASLAGINMNNMALSDAMHPDMYPEIIHSTDFTVKLLDMPVEVETKDSLVHTDLYDYVLNYTKRPWWGTVIGLPFKALGGIVKLLTGKEPEEEEGHDCIDPLRLTKEQAGVIKYLSKSVRATVERKTYVLTLEITLQDPVIAAQLANEVIDNLRDFIVTYRTEKSRENADYYKKIYEETKQEYLNAQRAYAYYMDTHQGITSKSTMVMQQQLQNEAQLRYQMYSQTAQNLLNAEAKVQQEAPVLVVIQPGRAPIHGKPSRVKTTLVWFLLGGIFGTSWVLFLRDRKKGKEEEEEPKAE